jgi:glycosyl hydrolase family 38
MRRRDFVFQIPTLAGLAGSAHGQPAKVRRVDLIHHTHTDVGYTELPSVVRELQKRYLDAAIDACRADAGFRWTVESLLGLDDWWSDRPKTRQEQFVQLVREGRMDVMAMPFNQTPFLNAAQWRQMMQWIPAERWQRLGIRAAMQNDVNGFPRAGAIALMDRGVRHLLMGINADSGGPPFRRPDAFWWKLPDGRRLFVWLGEHYGSAMRYLEAAREGVRMRADEASVRAAHAGLVKRLREIEGEGYGYERLILTFTHPMHYDNGSPYPSLGPFVAEWQKLRLEPALALATATEAVLAMEKEAGPRAPELEGEWTDWWANGDASGPREVAASRVAKRSLAAAMSPVFGPVPARVAPEVERILRDLCLFDEHTWGASRSISAPYGLNTLAQYAEKSDLAYRPMGMAEFLLSRRVRAAVDPLAAGIYVANPAPAEVSGWATIAASAAGERSRSLVDVKTGDRVALERQEGSFRFWVEKMPPRSIRAFRADDAEGVDIGGPGLEVRTDSLGWPVAASWPGMRKPLFEGGVGDFTGVAAVPPADRRTIAQLHANPDEEKRAEIRRTAFREVPASYGAAVLAETAHASVYTQEIRHPRLAEARRVLELWRGEPRARVSVRFDRLPSTAPEVLFLGFGLPPGLALPMFSSGGVPYTPYRDQLRGSCRDYFAIDGWARYHSPDGDWLWVSRDAPLVALGGPHVVERHQQEPGNPHRILAMVFDNCWHTNFVADSHGTMEFRFDLAWQPALERPAELAEALAGDLVVAANTAAHEEPALLEHLYRP